MREVALRRGIFLLLLALGLAMAALTRPLALPLASPFP
ncbi:rod shape-determining protein MreC, partial [Thermus scotoductus]